MTNGSYARYVLSVRSLCVEIGPKLESQLGCLLADYFRNSHLMSLGLGFQVCKMGSTLQTSAGHSEEYMRHHV